MRETMGSLRGYFLVVGVLGAASNLLGVMKQQSALTIVAAVIGLGVASVFLYLAVAVRSLIVGAPALVQRLLFVGGALILASAAVNAASNATIAMAQAVGGVVIVGYLISNVRRLAAEAAKKAADEHPAT